MIGLLQRVAGASVTVDDHTIAAIDAGLLVLIGVVTGDDESDCDRLLQRLLGYRVFADAGGRMNRSLRDTGGGLLLVPQFTLAANTRKGTRASFGRAAAPQTAQALFRRLAEQARNAHASVACGHFGADMQVALVNDGPVTFWLES